MELKSQEQLKKELSAPLPAEAIKPHPTKTYLSSIKAIYVTERLNDVFGIGKWTTAVEAIERGDKGMIVVKTTFTVPDYGIYYECYGGNDNGGEGSKNFDLGDAYKGATTDAITKIGSYLGIAIDVFKGKVSAPKAPSNNTPTNTTQPPADDNKPWLNQKTAKWDEVKKALISGYTWDQVLTKLKISKENRAAMDKEVETSKANPA